MAGMQSRKSAMELEIEKKVTIPMYFEAFIVPQIPDYYSVYPVDFDSKPVVCCPLHDENTPSFRYYEETNTFYCFGCRKGGREYGNVVNLHRLYYNRMNDAHITTAEAVKFLYNYFIVGNDLLPVVKIVQEQKLISPKEMFSLNYFRFNLEKMITFDESIDQSKKIKIWNMVDTLDLLISKNMVRSQDAKAYIQNQVTKILSE